MKKSEDLKNVHKPVMIKEVLNEAPRGKNKVVVDCTFGLGGHSFCVIERLEDSIVVGIDVDEETVDVAFDIARKKGFVVLGPAHANLHGWKLCDNKKNTLYLVKRNFSDLNEILDVLEIDEVNLAIFDLGFSTFQLMFSRRGFSYCGEEELLDQRYDRNCGYKACDLVNSLSRDALALIFRECGERKYAEAIAKAIASARKIKPIETNIELSKIIRKAVRYRSGGKYFKDIGKHPAMRCFLALRIIVNNEILSLSTALPQALEHLVAGSGGKLIVITFNSLEKQAVLNFLKNHEDAELLYEKKPSLREVAENPSSRSAVMYVIGKRDV
uniref:Ribosomal RNA small subunit methyltransferase H n=1 Tax=candidate division CPR3 bacterium TaxID=2268181 RepID=A0A7C5UUK0_UNCC3